MAFLFLKKNNSYPAFAGCESELEFENLLHQNLTILMKIPINHQHIKPIDSIIYLQGDLNYTYLFYENGKKKAIAKTLKRFEESPDFQDWFRVHRSYLVNPKFITSVRLFDSSIELNTGIILPISRRRLVKFKI
jgi:DNA-binding LytR/AlgR family response regulator